MNHVQRQALDRYNEAHRNRVALEVAECEAVVAGHVISDEMRHERTLAIRSEFEARIQARLLGVAA